MRIHKYADSSVSAWRNKLQSDILPNSPLSDELKHYLVDTFNKRDHGNINRHFERVLETELNKPNADSKKAHKRVRERSRKFGEKLQRIFHSAFSALMSCDENTDLSIHLNRKGVIEIIIPYTFQKHQDAFSLMVENVPTELITELEENILHAS